MPRRQGISMHFAGAIPIPAHADGAKGLLRVEPWIQRGELDVDTVSRVMEGGREAFSRRWVRLGREVGSV